MEKLWSPTLPQTSTRWSIQLQSKMLASKPGLLSIGYLVISPPGSFATNQRLCTTNNLITVNHKPNRLIRCLCYVERRVAITYQATFYNSLVLSHKRLEHCVLHFNDAKVLSHKRLEQYIVHFNDANKGFWNTYVTRNETANSAIATEPEKSCWESWIILEPFKLHELWRAHTVFEFKFPR